MLDNLIATDNPGGFNPGGRMNWAADLNLKLMSEVKSTEVLFWVGDGAFDMRNQRTLRAFVKVLKASGVDFAVLGWKSVTAATWRAGWAMRRLSSNWPSATSRH